MSVHVNDYVHYIDIDNNSNFLRLKAFLTLLSTMTQQHQLKKDMLTSPNKAASFSSFLFFLASVVFCLSVFSGTCASVLEYLLHGLGLEPPNSAAMST